MMEFFGILAWPIAWILVQLYHLIGSYGLALIILTVVIRFLLFPLTLKQMKSQRAMQRLQPLVKDIEKRYKGDKAMIQQETMALYKRENVSTTGGCLPMFIQMFVIMGLYQAIYRPLRYFYGLSNDQINALREVYSLDSKANESTLLTLMEENPSSMNGIIDNASSFNFIDFNFLGLNLAGTPAKPDFTDFSSFIGSADNLWIIPIIALATGIFTAIMTRQMNPMVEDKDNPMAAQTAKMSKYMMFVMPIMSLYFSFILPAAVGLYWAVANLLAGFQQLAISKMLKPLPPLKTDTRLMEKPRREVPETLDGQRRPQGKKGNKGQKSSSVMQNASGQRPAGQRPPGQRPPGQRPPGQRPAGQRPAGQRPPGQKPSGENNEGAPAAEKPKLQRMPGQRADPNEARRVQSGAKKKGPEPQKKKKRPEDDDLKPLPRRKPGQRPEGMPMRRKDTEAEKTLEAKVNAEAEEVKNAQEVAADIVREGEVFDDKS
ncbi:MAG: membrane protein insertase YidC [Clostridia bacterium]|nr:membrane protein insertase YidC [Clostridia bacterium]